MGVRRVITPAIAAVALVAACSPAEPEPATTTTPTSTSSSVPRSTAPATTVAVPPVIDPNGSYAVVAFTNHLPAYGTTAAGAPDRPWARLHTTRDYITMTRLVDAADAKVVLSFSPSLIRAIAQAATGHWDNAAVISAKPISDLTEEDRTYLDAVFFTASPDQIERFPRYRELAVRRAQGRTLSSSELRDLQALFNLAWTSPLLLEEEPFLSLSAKGRNYTEEDIQTILDGHTAVLGEFLDGLGRLSEEGKVELATSPLYNPTLPLLVRTGWDIDAAEQIVKGAEIVAAVLGDTPSGFAPHDGLIDQANAAAITGSGYGWALLAGAADDAPMRLTTESGEILGLPADDFFASRVAAEFYDDDPNAAALEVVRTLEQRLEGRMGAVTTIVADGTEPWGRFPDSGVSFLRSLLRQLGTASAFTTALPSEVNAALLLDPGPFPPLPDSFLSEPSELAAWGHLAETRSELLRARTVGAVPASALDEATDLILQAQDSDWFWWYGAERASGEDAYYDTLFRSKLRRAWELLGSTPPQWTAVPLHDPIPVAPSRRAQPGATTIEIDNSISESEWSGTGLYDERSSELIRRVFFTFDADNLYVRVDFTSEVLGDSDPAFDLYLGGPTAAGSGLSPDGTALEFEADRVVRWRATNPVRVSTAQDYPETATSDSAVVAGFDGTSIQFAVELTTIHPALRPGDRIDFRIMDVSGGREGGAFPAAGRGRFEVPKLAPGTELARIDDRTRDDYGPGSYSYVVDNEVAEGTYDLAGLVVTLLSAPAPPDAALADEVQFEISFRQPLTNPWSAPGGFSHQTIDVYLEANPGIAAGAARLLPGRVAATATGGWDYAISLDGWAARHYTADSAGNLTELASAIEYAVLGDQRTVLVTVDRASLPAGDETLWQYGVAVVANQAIPSLGIHGLRPLATVPGRFRLGGGTGAVNDPMLIDLLHPEAGVQEEVLTYPVAVMSGDPDALPIDRLARLPFVAG